MKLSDAFLAAYDPAAPVAPTGLIELIGGTAANESISGEDTASVTFGSDIGYADGQVTSQSWSMEYSFNALESHPSFKLIDDAAVNAIDTYLWFRKQSPPPPGGTVGRSIEGVVSVSDYSLDASADGILVGSCTLIGRGRPLVTPAT